MPTALKKKLLWLALLATVLGIGLLVAASFALRRPDVQNWLLSRLWHPAGYRLRLQVTGLDLSRGIGLSARNLVLSGPDSPPVTAERAHVSFRLPALFKGRLIPDRLDVSGLRMEIGGGRQPGLRPAQAFEKIWPHLQRLQQVHFKDAQVIFRKRGLRLTHLELDLSHAAAAETRLRLAASATAHYRQRTCAFEISALAGKHRSTPGPLWVRGKLAARRVPLAWLPANRFMDFANSAVDIQLQFSASADGALTASGQASGPRLDVALTHKSARKAYHLRQPVLKFHLTTDGRNFELPDFSLQSRRFHLTGKAAFGAQDGAVPRLSLTVQSPDMTIAAAKALFPAPLLPAWYESRLLPLFTRGQIRLDAFRLDGTLEQLAHLDHRANRSHLVLLLTLKDVQAFKPVLPLAFEDATGRLVLADGKLSITGIDGMFGRSVIRNAVYRIPDLYAHPAVEIMEIRGRFRLEDFNKLRRSRLLAAGRTNAPQPMEPLSGTMQGTVALRVRHWNVAPRVTAARLHLTNCRLHWRPLDVTFAIERGQLVLSNSRTWRYRGQGRWENSPFDFAGTLNTSPAAGQVAITSQTDWHAVLAQLGNPAGLRVNPRTAAASRFQVNWKPGAWRVTAGIDLSGMGVRSPAFAVAAFKPGSRLSLDVRSPAGRVIDIRRADLTSGTTSLHLTGTFTRGAKPSVHLELQTDYFSLQGLGLRLASARFPTAGIFSGRMAIDTSLTDLSHAMINGNLAGEAVALPAGALPLPVSRVQLKLVFSGRQVQIKLLRLLLNGQPVFVNGTVRLGKTLRGTLSLAADTLDLSHGLRFSPPQTSPSGSRLGRTELKLHITADRIRLKDFAAGPLKAVCTYRSPDFIVDSAAIQLAHGTIRTRGEYTPGRQPAWHLYAHVELTRQPIAQLLKQLGVPTDCFDGLATLAGVFSMRGNGWPELVCGLNGAFNLWVQEGIIRRSSVIVKVLDFLSLKNILDRRPSAGDGFYFTDLQNKSTITNGTLSLDYFKMQSPVFNALAEGSIDLPSGRLDIDMGAQPLGTIDTLVSHIPIVGHILTGKDKSVLVYRFKITGNLQHPEIGYQPFKNIGKSTLDYFRRILLTPGRLWSRFSDFKNDSIKRLGYPDIKRWKMETDPRYSHTIR